jgi:hypothetical protein
VFYTKNWQIVKEFRAYQANNTDLPSDEQLNVVNLNKITVDPDMPDTVTFSLKLTTVAGTSVTVLLPLPL